MEAIFTLPSLLMFLKGWDNIFQSASMKSNLSGFEFMNLYAA